MYSIISAGPPIHITALPCLLDMVSNKVVAGFPSPAEDEGASRIDLNKELVIHPQATYVQRVAGDSMQDAGIFNNDILVIDKAIKPRHKMIVVAVVDGEFTVKQLYQRAGRVKLQAANPTYPDIVPKEGQTIEIWGVVTSCIKQFPSA